DTSKAVPTNVSKTVADTSKTVADTTSTPANPTAVVKADSAAVPAGMVSGVVTDQYGPSPGVTVSVKGTDRKAISDPDGKYQIAAGEADVLVFASMGFTAKEEPVGTRKVIDIAMQAEAKELEEVQVVATAYGTVDRRKLTSAVSSIGADQIENEVLPSITQAIQGKAGGVQVTQKSGSPGGGLSIRVRGTTSINASSDPLYVVDGIPVNSTTNFTGGTNFNFGGGTQGINVLSSINPSDVQSVEVLKDAASSSIYGARAANGVVLITTKRGQAGTSSFTFNAYEGFSQVPKERLYKFMNTADYQDYMRDFYKYLVDEDGVSTPVPAGILANPNINTDWQNEIFRVAPTRNYEIAARGGSEKTRYYTSVGYMKQSGVIQNSDFSRLSGRLNLDHEHSDKLKFSTSINLTRALNDRVQEENSKEGSTKNGIVTPPNIPVY
ncbi:MAG: SusC/RagA family TonB-linked outer membrane protein, partial [Pedobacter sp.]